MDVDIAPQAAQGLNVSVPPHPAVTSHSPDTNSKKPPDPSLIVVTSPDTLRAEPVTSARPKSDGPGYSSHVVKPKPKTVPPSSFVNTHKQKEIKMCIAPLGLAFSGETAFLSNFHPATIKVDVYGV